MKRFLVTQDVRSQPCIKRVSLCTRKRRVLTTGPSREVPEEGLFSEALGRQTKKRRCQGLVMEREGREAYWSRREGHSPS